MPAELTALAFFAPIAAFLIVFVVVFAVLFKTKVLGENKWANLFVAFLIATVFISTAGAVRYIGTVIPWFAVVIVSLAFILILTGFIGEPAKSMNKGISIAFVIILSLVFLISGFLVFSKLILSYLPGPNFGTGLTEGEFFFLDWLYSPRIAGAVILLVVSALVSWVLVKSGDKKE